MKTGIKGYLAEALARILFRLKGYRIVAANYVTGRGTGAGEIDFIAAGHKVLVFVEVKERGSLDNAAYAISSKQQRRIAKAAENFYLKNPRFQGYDIRFDAVLVSFPWHLRHIVNAWSL